VIGDIFVFDNVIHVYDMSVENIRQDRADAPGARDQVMKFTRSLR
jgi:hypothetical protein